MTATVVMRRVWPPLPGWERCTVTIDRQHWPFPHHNGSACCAACGMILPKSALDALKRARDSAALRDAAGGTWPPVTT